MINSTFILSILDLAFDNENQADLLKNQIPFLTEGKTTHTGAGLFIDFLKDKDINKYVATFETYSDILDNGDKENFFNGVFIKNDSLNIWAEATVHLLNGIIDSLEIKNQNGHLYPLEEPQNYELTQEWLDVSIRRMIVK